MNTQVRELEIGPLQLDAQEPAALAVLRGIGQRLLPWLVPVGLIAFWQIASAFGWLSTRILPAPVEVLKAAWTTTR